MYQNARAKNDNLNVHKNHAQFNTFTSVHDFNIVCHSFYSRSMDNQPITAGICGFYLQEFILRHVLFFVFGKKEISNGRENPIEKKVDTILKW